MRKILLFVAALPMIAPAKSGAVPIGYDFTITTAFATDDPFPNRQDEAWTAATTGYVGIANTGATTFSGTVATIALSSFAGDLSFTSQPLTLAPGTQVSIAIPDDSSAVGGFNGPYYYYRPGVEIALSGTVSAGAATEPVTLIVADADIHSGVVQADPHGLISDSFVLQGGDPWGFDNGAAYALGLADGVAVLSEAGPRTGGIAGAVPEPRSILALSTGTVLLAGLRRIRRRRA